MNELKEISRLMHRPLSSDRSGGAGAAIAVVIILVVVAVAGYFVVLHGNHATLNITVQSTHILADTDVTVYVDGRDIGTWRIGNLEGGAISYNYSWSIFDDAKIIEVRAVSTGGFWGAQGDSKTITVYKGGTNNVILLI